jgi:hypothetical protein
MIHQKLSSILRITILFLISILIISIPVIASDTAGPSLSQSGVLFSGSIPSGDGIVPIKATSGKLYQIPAMTPLGVVQTLAGTGSIDSYSVGDELLNKKGILTLDGVNNLTYAGDRSWFVLVNNRQLEDYLLPTQEGLNIYPLKTGDVVLYAYGNPLRPITESIATMTVTLQFQTGTGIPVITGNTSIPTPVQTPVVTPVPTPFPTPEPTPVQTPVVTPVPTPFPTPEPTPVQTPVMTPVPTPFPTPEPSPVPPMKESGMSSVSGIDDPNKPVYEEEESENSGSDSNQPVYEDESDTGESEPDSSGKDPNKPVYEDGSDTETTGEEEQEEIEEKPAEEEEEETEEEVSEPEEEPSQKTVSKTSSSGQTILYEGSISLPSGNINVTADSEVEYDVSANTPIGLLQILSNDGKVDSIIISDKGMNKGGILTIMGINDYSYGEEGWFVQINGNTLQDYINPGSDGLNIRTFSRGDEIVYFYGKLDQTPSSAKVLITIKID